MANLRRRLRENVAGEFFVDDTCINCDACRQLAPETFGEENDFSFVRSQPSLASERRNATRALLACPTGSIGTTGKNESQSVMDDFPLEIEENVYYCGFNSAKSFGGNSYFIRHPEGNWLVDSPKYLPHLVRQFEKLGGIRHIFLTHRDDVADAARYASKFEANRIIHRFELASQPDAETVLDGGDPIQIQAEFLVIPTFGHTKGHCALLYKNRFLFSGDHLWWSRNRNSLNASEDVCWYSWGEQVDSVGALIKYNFEWILPGHGERANFSGNDMNIRMKELHSRLRK